MVVIWDISWTRELAWALRSACVQEAISETAGCSTCCGTETGMTWVLKAWEAESGVRGTCVWMRVQGLGARMGSFMRCCWAGLLCCHGTVLCRGGGALGSSGATVHAEALNREGRTVYSCVHLCTQGALGRTGLATPTARPTGFVVDVGDQDFRGHRRARAKDFEDRHICGEWRRLRQTKGHSALTLQLLLGHCNCLLLSCLWAQHLCYF